MNLIRGFVAVVVGLAITLVFVQVLESTLATALAGRPLQSLDEYAFAPLLAVSTAGMLGGAAVRAAAASIRRKQREGS